MPLKTEEYGDLRVCETTPCKRCRGSRRVRPWVLDARRVTCPDCFGAGFEHTHTLKDSWSRPAFLVCGGPSLRDVDTSKLQGRGIVSLAVNNVAAYAPVDAWCFSDGQTKFHHALYLDPKITTFAPTPKLRKRIRIKDSEGFKMTTKRVADCPNTYGFSRSGRLYPDDFFATNFAHWGYGGKQPESEQPFRRLCTMMLGMRLLHYLGCRIIYLLGVDFWIDTTKPYAFEQAKGGGNNAWKKNRAMLESIEPAREREGMQIYNCNPASQLDLYPHVPYDVALTVCRGCHITDGQLDTADWYTKSITRRDQERFPEPITLP